ncbi:hypothetical protein PBN151_3051 [Paenibacillus sp. NAIST15-1]|nr:hypothetical protein PBN151_3051 [Paenibacillus sp. NAIST15-1]
MKHKVKRPIFGTLAIARAFALIGAAKQLFLPKIAFTSRISRYTSIG